MIFNRSVPCSPEEVPEREGGKVKRSVRWNPNRESLYCLLLLVRVVRVVRGSRNSNRVSVGMSRRCGLGVGESCGVESKKKTCPTTKEGRRAGLGVKGGKMVEAAGIEPASERPKLTSSPSSVPCLYNPAPGYPGTGGCLSLFRISHRRLAKDPIPHCGVSPRLAGEGEGNGYLILSSECVIVCS